MTMDAAPQDFDPDGRWMAKPMESKAEIEASMIHYHYDTGDLPWPGPNDADCHYGIANAKVSRDDLPARIRATKNADELINVLREAAESLDSSEILTVFPDPPIHCRGCSRHMNIRWERQTEHNWTLVARCSRPWWVAVMGEHDVAIQNYKTKEWKYQ